MDDKKLTVKETIDILGALDGTFNFDESEVSGGNIALDEAIMLLEKLIPKKPEANSYYYLCPTCGTRRSSRQKHNYCHDCGQALDWSE